jgi:large subunit ribosomal protein L22
MEVKAINRYVGSSPRKMRLVVDLIRGKGVEEALSMLHFVPKQAAKTVEKVLRSAISNYQNREETGRVDTATLYIKSVFVDGGPTAKRILPAPMGRAFRLRKRSNHITVIVAQREREATVAKKRSEQKAKKAVQTKQPVATAS